MQHILYIENAKRLAVEQGCLTVIDPEDQTITLHCDDVLAVVESTFCQVSTPALLLCVELAIESISARIYFNGLLGDDFKRFENDAVNSALNYGYALIRGLIMVAITVKGLHPTLGIWHHSVRNRFNLSDDLIEILRPLVDNYVFRMNLENDFTVQHRQALLSLLYATVYWQGKPYRLKQAINLYLDDFIGFMDESSDIINLIKLVIPYDSN